MITQSILNGFCFTIPLFEGLFKLKNVIFKYIQNSNIKLNEYAKFEYFKNPYSLDALGVPYIVTRKKRAMMNDSLIACANATLNKSLM